MSVCRDWRKNFRNDEENMLRIERNQSVEFRYLRFFTFTFWGLILKFRRILIVLFSRFWLDFVALRCWWMKLECNYKFLGMNFFFKICRFSSYVWLDDFFFSIFFINFFRFKFEFRLRKFLMTCLNINKTIFPKFYWSLIGGK